MVGRRFLACIFVILVLMLPTQHQTRASAFQDETDTPTPTITLTPTPTETPTPTATPGNIQAIPLSSGNTLIVQRTITYGDIFVGLSVLMLWVLGVIVLAVFGVRQWR